MIFIDSWVFIEYFFSRKKVEKIVEGEESKIISSACITEIKYKIAKHFGIEKANELMNIISSMKSLRILPVTKEVAEYAADLRLKYYSKSRQMSFVDCINLATAILSGCDKLYTGDIDFDGIEEIKTEIIR